MSHACKGGRSSGRGLVAARILAAVGLASAVGLTGCESDSWLLSPAVVGRWEHTATRVPILTRITSIEGPEEFEYQVSQPTAEDLLPEPFDYRIGPGDGIRVIMFDVLQQGQALPVEASVDSRGYIDLLQVGKVYVSGMTEEEARQAIADACRVYVADPLVQVQVLNQRQLRYTATGVLRPGPYIIPAADFRLLEAIATAGGWALPPEDAYIIREVPLNPGSASTAPIPAPGQSTTPAPKPTGEELLKTIEDLTKPQEEPKPAFPGAFSGGAGAGTWTRTQPEKQTEPPIDLVDPRAKTPAGKTSGVPQIGDSSWVFLNGEWVQVQRRAKAGAAEGANPTPGSGSKSPVFTQRVIRVDAIRLTRGDPTQNVVIRPGDNIRLETVTGGQVYLAGEINRPGAYGLAPKLTLLRLLDAAGGFSPIGIPERVDLTRMVGENTQATIRLDLRAINEGTQPDLYIKANDRINVGTNFWAYPMAIIRNGFRFTYGFAFVIDRNFDDYIFGSETFQGGIVPF